MIPSGVRFALIAISVVFLATGGYHRVQSQRSGESLDRSKEGWPTMIAIRFFGLLTFGSGFLWIWKPAWFMWAAQPVPNVVRWVGVAGFGCAVAWLIWMFRTLGKNLTDTVVVRRDAYFVSHGPYRYVRNPMYTGILLVGMTLGMALGTIVVPVAATAMFTLLALRTRKEEKYLLERFGDPYQQYMARVGRFFPKRYSTTSRRNASAA